MKILITGSTGFVGKNLVEGLKNIRDGKDKTRDFTIEEIFEYTRNSTQEDLDKYCKEADFIFNLVGINRSQKDEDFYEGNYGFVSNLLETLKRYNNKAPVMISSSIQASLEGRYKDSTYGESKLLGEKILFKYAEETGNKVLIYRFPNLFGKWSKPNYNSVIATFCYNLANDLPINVNDRDTKLELVYIDDLLEEMYKALSGNESRCDFNGLDVIEGENGKYCFVKDSHHASLGEIVDILEEIKNQPKTLLIPKIPEGSLAKKLYSTYLSFLPIDKIKFEFKSNLDNRGSFTELIKTKDTGQFSVNVSKPGITKGQHWHNTKWEMFIVVSGKARIEIRKIGTKEKISFEVSGEKFEAVQMLPGYTHNIINLSETEDLVTLMWANEAFDTKKPDTYYEEV